MTHEHSPREWRIGSEYEGNERRPYYIVETDYCHVVAHVVRRKTRVTQDKANARLIAAAPDYAEAAELAIACMAMEGEHKDHDAPCWLDKMILAHAKATGDECR